MPSPTAFNIMAARVVMVAATLALTGCASSPRAHSTAPSPSGLTKVSTTLFIKPGDNPELPALPPPKVLTSPAPHVPPDAAPLPHPAEMILVVDIGTEGQVRSVMVARSTYMRELDRVALDALQQWRFEPVVHDGSAIAVRARVRVIFEARGR
ncbi:TonB family protein [Stenotrophomonas indicatrix]|uniref:TonB family protein n=1 Tax=Stenotrophomonas indicatrix TaxID=2045451 RepID=UPI00289C5722|nr:TonB family protein [Stenotrophomonas indicatrix]